jgi:hypothetical protein
VQICIENKVSLDVTKQKLMDVVKGRPNPAALVVGLTIVMVIGSAVGIFDIHHLARAKNLNYGRSARSYHSANILDTRGQGDLHHCSAATNTDSGGDAHHQKVE